MRRSARAWMLAIYQNNPSAFDGNMNVLRSGARCCAFRTRCGRVCHRAERSGPRRSAASTLRGVVVPLRGLPLPARLRMSRVVCVSWRRALPGGGSTTADAANTALQGRVRELEAQLTESRRLLEARNAELAQLQARLSQQPAAPAATAAGRRRLRKPLRLSAPRCRSDPAACC